MVLSSFVTALFPTVALLGIGFLIYEMTRPRPQYLTYEQGRSGFRDAPQMPAKKASNSTRQRPEAEKPKTDPKNPCRLCGGSIEDIENGLTKLSCDHEFHEKCIKRHFNANKNHINNEARCPARPYCTTKYSLAAET